MIKILMVEYFLPLEHVTTSQRKKRQISPDTARSTDRQSKRSRHPVSDENSCSGLSSSSLKKTPNRNLGREFDEVEAEVQSSKSGE